MEDKKKLIGYIMEKWGHSGFQRYFRNTGWLFLSQFIRMAVTFLATIFIARVLGPSNFGQLSYATSFIAIFGVFASLGIDNILYRDLIKNPEKKNELLGSAFLLKIFAGSLMALVVIAAAEFFSSDDVSKILIFILSGTFIFNSFQIINFEFQAQVKSKYPSIIDVLINLILNSLKVLVLFLHKGVIYLAAILLLESVLYIVFYWYAYEIKIGGRVRNWRFNKNVAVGLLRDSWPLIFTSAFMMVYSRIDQVFIKQMLDATSVGLYGAAVRIAELWYFIPGIIISSLFPAIINAKITSEELYYARLKKLAFFLFGIATLISIAVTVFAPLLIKIIYGSAFLGGTLVLQIYVWACLGTFLGILIDNYLVAENQKKVLVFKSLIPMVVNVVLNILWIPKYGIVGSAYATLISYTLGPLVILLFRQTRRKVLETKRYGENKS